MAKTAVTNGSGQVTFTLIPGDYNFAADFNGTRFYSGGGSGVDTCTIPGCTSNTVTVPALAPPNATLPPTTCSLSGSTRTCDLWAKAGTLPLPDGGSVPFWGYAMASADPAGLPGVDTAIIANLNETIVVNLHNVDIPDSTSLLFQGQSLVPDRVGVAAGGMTTYTFTASKPGTFIYEAGLTPDGPIQVAMGLYGALIVRPSNTGQAYADPETAFNDEALAVLGEIDPALNTAGDPTGFDLRDFAPKYYLINGKAYADTQNIVTSGGDRLLLRYVNGGVEYHSMALLGIHQTVISNDGSLLGYSHRMVAETIGPGQSADVIITIPASAPQGSKFPLYDGNLMLHNSSAGGFGGMLTFLMVGTPGAPGADTLGPTTLDVTLTPNGSDISVDATVSDVNSGNSNIAAAEYYIDSTSGTGTGMTGAFGSPTAVVQGTISAATIGGLSSGSHTIYVRGQDSAGNWGPFNFAVLGNDLSGPATYGLTLTPNPSNGSQDVALNGTGDDSETGNSIITAAEYTIDGGTPTAMAVNVPASVASLDAVIPAATVNGLSEGSHTVSVRSQDAAGNWGMPVTIDLIVDKTGPVTGVVTAVLNPSNGKLGFNSSILAVQVKAPFADTTSNLSAAEGFIDTVGADGTGFPLISTDAVFNSLTETGYVNIPLSTIAQLSDGDHTIYVHGKDAAGNWGPTSSTVLTVDRTPPVVSNVAVSPNPTLGATSVNLTATANDNQTGVARAEWFVAGSDPGKGLATPMAINGANLTATIDVSTWADGSYTISVRALDGTGNWSTPVSTTLVVSQSLYFSTSGNGNSGVLGAYNDSDIFSWNSGNNSLATLATAGQLGLGGGGVNIDGLAMVDATHFYVSFSSSVNPPGPLGTVQDEDVVYYDAGTWSLFFDGGANGLGGFGGSGFDLDAISVVNGQLYFSTDNNNVPSGAGGSGDDADIYRWDGGSNYTRVWDASAHGVSNNADVDGLSLVDATHFYLSFNADTTITGLGAVQDEDVVYYNAGAWSVYFDGTARGLTNGNQDLDAIDVP